MSLAECIACIEFLPRAYKAKLAYQIEPLKDIRWNALVQRHAEASLFHSSAWLQALQSTYGYRPVAFTTSEPGQRLENAMVFCQVESWLTGKRLVSLPFSDHCQPLTHEPEDLDAMALALEEEFRGGRWRYIETRPLRSVDLDLALPHCVIPYTLHQLDLAPSVETLFRNCHKDSTQRKIRRAEREGLRYREGSTQDLLEIFYRLHALTRQRHARPPQPKQWFGNLMQAFGPDLAIRVAFLRDRAVAAILTIRHKDTLVYKYGGSDPRFHNLGGMHLLLWGAIQDAKSAGLRCFDFGRTAADQTGLIVFKKRWCSEQTDLFYSRYGLADSVAEVFESGESWKAKLAKGLLARMSPGALSVAGRILYKHVG